MPQVADWLKKLGLELYAQQFAENSIDDISVLRHLTDQDLKDIGVPLGHRRKMLAAIAEQGAIVPAPAPALKSQDTAERRQLTVMFVDLVGSTTLSTKLDPEDLRGVVNAYHRCATEFIERSGGFVAKYMGDGVLAYFGYPRAHEHDAELAVRAGLALVEAVPKLKTAAGVPLQIRIGIATGLVVVGDLIGAGAAQEQAVVGETPNLAARLQALAEPGAVVIAASTRRLTGGLFEYRDLGAVALKGFADTTQVWQVLGAGAAESRFEALRATSTPLIGREEEIDLLMRRWEQAKLGDGQVVLICGEPGIGKSRIAQTVTDRIGQEPHTRLRYFCSPHHQDSAFYPSIAQLERAAGFRREDTPEQRLAKLEAVLAQGTNDLGEAIPLLADLLSVPAGGPYAPLNLSPQRRKEKTIQAQLTQIEGLAARQPLLMAWEDIHWSDPTTRESLDLLVDRVAALRVLVVLTFRPEFTPPWTGRPHVTLLTLSRLTPRQRAQMVGYMTGGKPLPKEITDQIVERTDGVPLFIEELTKSVVESGILTEAGDRYALAGPAAPLAIPTSLHASLLARLDRLAPTREIAQIGAALGRQFSHELISAVAQMPQQQIDDALAQLTSAELIFRRGTPPDAEYTFKHALVQDAAYSTLLHSKRQLIPGRIVSILESQFTEMGSAQPQLLAQHCTDAGLKEKAIQYSLKAGQQALLRSAMWEAEAQLRKGLELLAGLAEGVERLEYELDLQMALANAVTSTHGLASPAMSDVLARARQLSEQLDRPPQRAIILASQANIRVLRGELVQAAAESRELLNLGRARNDPMVMLLGYAEIVLALFHLGDFVATREYALQAATLDEPSAFALLAVDLRTMALTFVFRSLTYMGKLIEARSIRAEAFARARELKHAHNLAMLLSIALITDMHAKSDPTQLLLEVEELENLCLEHGFPYWAPAAAWVRGSSMMAMGQSGEALKHLRQSLTGLRAIGGPVMTVAPACLTSLAAALAKQGCYTEAFEYLDEAERQIESTEERWTEAELHCVRGELFAMRGEAVAAEASFRKAIDLARRQSAKLWELRVAMSLARFWRARGRSTEARDLLAPVYGWFTEGFDTPVLKEAKALLDELAA
jgi:class 3 adenylate cyclase/tetratricopeptide (TPR) repeat protein